MPFKIKNAIIFLGIGIALILVYVFFIKKSSSDTAPLVSASGTPVTATTTTPGATSAVTQDFLSVLLNVNSIKLNDDIFSDPAFQSLHDSSIVLVPDPNPGRPNPFAQIGVDVTSPAPVTTSTTTPPAAPATSGTTTAPPATSGTTSNPTPPAKGANP